MGSKAICIYYTIAGEESVLWRYNEREKVVVVRDVFCRFARVLSRMGLRVTGNNSAVCSWSTTIPR